MPLKTGQQSCRFGDQVSTQFALMLTFGANCFHPCHKRAVKLGLKRIRLPHGRSIEQ